MAQPPPAQWRQAAPDSFWISGLLMDGAVQQTVQGPHFRPDIKVMPSHMAQSWHGRAAPAP
jgi:hypothetical protein